MKIGPATDTHISVNQATAAAAQKTGQGAAAVASGNAAKSTRSAGVAVTVSTQVRGLEEAKTSAAADVDMQKVATVRAAIQDGSYVVNPEAIADKLLSNAQEMLDRTTN